MIPIHPVVIIVYVLVIGLCIIKLIKLSNYNNSKDKEIAQLKRKNISYNQDVTKYIDALNKVTKDYNVLQNKFNTLVEYRKNLILKYGKAQRRIENLESKVTILLDERK